MLIKLYEEFVATLPKIDTMNKEATMEPPKKIDPPTDVKFDGKVYSIAGWNVY